MLSVALSVVLLIGRLTSLRTCPGGCWSHVEPEPKTRDTAQTDSTENWGEGRKGKLLFLQKQIQVSVNLGYSVCVCVCVCERERETSTITRWYSRKWRTSQVSHVASLKYFLSHKRKYPKSINFNGSAFHTYLEVLDFNFFLIYISWQLNIVLFQK